MRMRSNYYFSESWAAGECAVLQAVARHIFISGVSSPRRSTGWDELARRERRFAADETKERPNRGNKASSRAKTGGRGGSLISPQRLCGVVSPGPLFPPGRTTALGRFEAVSSSYHQQPHRSLRKNRSPGGIVKPCAPSLENGAPLYTSLTVGWPGPNCALDPRCGTAGTQQQDKYPYWVKEIRLIPHSNISRNPNYLAAYQVPAANPTKHYVCLNQRILPVADNTPLSRQVSSWTLLHLNRMSLGIDHGFLGLGVNPLRPLPRRQRHRGATGLDDRRLGDHSVGDHSVCDHSVGDRFVGDCSVGGHSVGDRSSGKREQGMLSARWDFFACCCPAVLCGSMLAAKPAATG